MRRALQTFGRSLRIKIDGVDADEHDPSPAPTVASRRLLQVVQSPCRSPPATHDGSEPSPTPSALSSPFSPTSFSSLRSPSFANFSLRRFRSQTSTPSTINPTAPATPDSAFNFPSEELNRPLDMSALDGTRSPVSIIDMPLQAPVHLDGQDMMLFHDDDPFSRARIGSHPFRDSLASFTSQSVETKVPKDGRLSMASIRSRFSRARSYNSLRPTENSLSYSTSTLPSSAVSPRASFQSGLGQIHSLQTSLDSPASITNQSLPLTTSAPRQPQKKSSLSKLIYAAPTPIPTISSANIGKTDASPLPAIPSMADELSSLLDMYIQSDEVVSQQAPKSIPSSGSQVSLPGMRYKSRLHGLHRRAATLLSLNDVIPPVPEIPHLFKADDIQLSSAATNDGSVMNAWNSSQTLSDLEKSLESLEKSVRIKDRRRSATLSNLVYEKANKSSMTASQSMEIRDFRAYTSTSDIARDLPSIPVSCEADPTIDPLLDSARLGKDQSDSQRTIGPRKSPPLPSIPFDVQPDLSRSEQLMASLADLDVAFFKRTGRILKHRDGLTISVRRRARASPIGPSPCEPLPALPTSVAVYL